MNMDIEVCFSTYKAVVSGEFIFLIDPIFMQLQDLSKNYTIILLFMITMWWLH
jgi:hypothetical protein